MVLNAKNPKNYNYIRTLREWRAYKKMDKKAVAKALCVSESTYTRMENAPHKISIGNAVVLSKLFGCDMKEINFFE
ncbi:helix-turn-helix transcriptional regulator [Paenibacillus kribbensis]|uniref:helix-turn-helix domain-containing protein n=1 Tax=Paenibacillus kribbensis TaxID=172713 RepID=UPI002DBD7EEA|nr:helix-turn-helix transcriptional regulator [Paenibacillus kribbensis]MEC0234035.1 helix-turn-helix transcriptional regulator [Paenibacillus kribbensis]